MQRATQGGHHFVDFHYELHAGRIGVWIVGITTMIMLAGEGAEFEGDITWNFEKFLVGKDGRVLARF